MKTYLLTTKQGANATFKYQDGLLIRFAASDFTTEQLRYLLPRLPIEETHIATLNKAIPRITIKEVVEDVTFNDFFTRYSASYGERVDKKKAHLQWNKLSRAAQSMAYDFVAAYAARCKRNNIAMKMAKTYLNQEPWND